MMEANDEAAGRPLPPMEVFRPHGWLRALVVGLTLFWVLVFFLLVRFGGATGGTFASVGFFVTFFTALGVFYSNNRIELLPDAFVIRGVMSHARVPYLLVMGVEASRGLAYTTYRVQTTVRPFVFSSLFAGHVRLARLIEERARAARADPSNARVVV